MTAERAPRRLVVATAAGVCCFLFSVGISALVTFGSARARGESDFLAATIVLVPSIVLGVLVTWQVPANPVGAALTWLAAAPAAVAAVEDWGSSLLSAHPWPGATAMFVLKQGFWVWNLAGFGALCMLFPDGRSASVRLRRLPVYGVVAAVLLNAVVSLDPRSHLVDGVSRAGYALHVPTAVSNAALIVTSVAYLAVFGSTVASVIVRYRRGDEVVRLQLRWLILTAGLVPVLLGGGWIIGLYGVPVQIWGVAFMAVMLLAVPVAVAIAVLRYDLYDVDRLLGSSLAWALTSVVSAGVFAVAIYAIGDVIGAGSRIGVTGAAFLTALLLLPLQPRLHDSAGRLVDRERAVMLAAVDAFVTQVRDGEAAPEQVETVLRAVLHDDDLQLLLCAPGGVDYRNMRGAPTEPTGPHQVPLRSGDVNVGVIILSSGSRRRLRQAADIARRARLPIEVARLQLELRVAVEQVTASRARLVAASATERHRLERDLHDGAQQQLVALGMRLRSLQGRLDPDAETTRELDAAVGALQETVHELRSLAHGLRPPRLTEGIARGLRELVRNSPVPVALTVPDVTLPEVVLTNVYFVVAECLANALKHGHAHAIEIHLAESDGRLTVKVRDDGVGGASDGFGLTSVRDRIAALGGSVELHSPPGAGTCVLVRL